MASITIIGGGPSWKDCEFRTTELWGCLNYLNQPELGDKPYTKLFAFDGFEYGENGVKKTNYLLKKAHELAIQRNIPIIGNQPFCTQQYPIRDVVRHFNSAYFMPTISYMIAYALFIDFDRLYLHGIDGGPQWQYQFAKPQIMFWLGVACALKKQVVMGHNSLRWAYQAGLDTLPQAFFLAYNYHQMTASEFEEWLDGSKR